MPKDTAKPRLTARCAKCGNKIQRNGIKAPWRHERPTPSGAAHTHSAVPVKK